MIEHIFSQIEFKIIDQAGQTPDGRPQKLKMLVFFQPGKEQEEHWVLPLTTEAAHIMARGLTGGVIIGSNGQPGGPEAKAIEDALRRTRPKG